MAISDTSPALLAAQGVGKRFGTFAALDSVDFDVRAGEVHALLGENGAGKSTLMNILSGLLRPSDGTVLRDGRPVQFASPRDAQAQGIGMVHQHFLLVPPLSVRENLLLGASAKWGGPLSYPVGKVEDEARAVADKLGWRIPWEAPAGNLPVGTQQRVEILKALRGDTRVLIFDEPTAVLTPTETPELFATIRQIAHDGRGIVFISHKLDEVLALARRVTVLRRGRVVHRTTTEGATAASLAQAMVGPGSEAAILLDAAPPAAPRPDSTTDTAPRLRVEGLTLRGPARPLLDNISLTVAAGEILAIAGVDGNGQGELAECLTGLLRPQSGVIQIGAMAPAPTPQAFRRAGVASIPADRQTRGLALSLSLTENIALGVWDKVEFRRGPLLLWPRLRDRATGLIQSFDIRAEGPDSAAASLSGGNQQKVVIARALSDNPRVVVAVNPTRGLDVGAIAYVHQALRAARDRGAAIVLISTELEEVLALSSGRVAVLFEGRLSGIVARDTPRETLGLLMGGKADGP